MSLAGSVERSLWASLLLLSKLGALPRLLLLLTTLGVLETLLLLLAKLKVQQALVLSGLVTVAKGSARGGCPDATARLATTGCHKRLQHCCRSRRRQVGVTAPAAYTRTRTHGIAPAEAY